MKHSVGLLAVVVAVTAAPAFAADVAKPIRPIVLTPAPVVLGHSGDISIYGGWTRQHIVEEGGDDIQNYTGSLFGGLARANWWVSPNTNVQLELSGEHWTTTEHNHHAVNVLNGAVHIDWAHPNGGLFGGFASIGTNNDFCCSTATFGTVALEAQTRTSWPALTLYGQVGYSTLLAGAAASVALDDEGDRPSHGGYFHLAALYALSPNVHLGANVGDAFLSVDEHPLNILRWGVSLDFTPVGHPLDLFLAYQGHHTNIMESGDLVTVHAFLAGVKLRFGTDVNAPMRVDYNPFTGFNNPRDAY
jgi:hypothetical protein